MTFFKVFIGLALVALVVYEVISLIFAIKRRKSEKKQSDGVDKSKSEDTNTK